MAESAAPRFEAPIADSATLSGPPPLADQPATSLSIALSSRVCDAGADVSGSVLIRLPSTLDSDARRFRLSARIVCECKIVRDCESSSRHLVFDHTRIERTTCIAELPVALPFDGILRDQTDVHFTARLPRDWPGTLALAHFREPGDPEWVAAGERLLAQCTVSSRIEARLLQVSDGIAASDDRAAVALTSCPVSVHPAARRVLQQPAEHDSVIVLTCRPVESRSGGAATLQLGLDGGSLAAQWPDTTSAGCDASSSAPAADGSTTLHPAPTVVVHAHIHNPTPVDASAFRLRVLRRVEYCGSGFGGGVGSEPLVFESELGTLEDLRPERRRSSSGGIRCWRLPLPLRAGVGGVDESAGGSHEWLTVPSCALARWGISIEHCVEVKVWFEGCREPFSARLPFWLDPPPVSPVTPVPLLPSRAGASSAKSVHPAALAILGRGRGSIQRAESLPRESPASPASK